MLFHAWLAMKSESNSARACPISRHKSISSRVLGKIFGTYNPHNRSDFLVPQDTFMIRFSFVRYSNRTEKHVLHRLTKCHSAPHPVPNTPPPPVATELPPLTACLRRASRRCAAAPDPPRPRASGSGARGRRRRRDLPGAGIRARRGEWEGTKGRDKGVEFKFKLSHAIFWGLEG